MLFNVLPIWMLRMQKFRCEAICQYISQKKKNFARKSSYVCKKKFDLSLVSLTRYLMRLRPGKWSLDKTSLAVSNLGCKHYTDISTLYIPSLYVNYYIHLCMCKRFWKISPLLKKLKSPISKAIRFTVYIRIQRNIH